MKRQAVNIVRSLCGCTVGICGFGIGIGYLGGLHPVGDSLAVFRMMFASIGSVALCFTSQPHSIRAIWGIFFACAVLPIILQNGVWKVAHDTDHGPRTIGLYQQNIWRQNSDINRLVSAIQNSSADFITLQEVTSENQRAVRRLGNDFPYFHICNDSNLDGEAVFSRWPSVADTARCAMGVAYMQVSSEFGPIWLVSVHLDWPWPFYQMRQLDQLISILSSLQGPVLIGGDFNAVSWSHTIKRVAEVTEADRVKGVSPTIFIGPLPVGVDHVFWSASRDGYIRTMPKYGSDHKGLFVRLPPPDS